MAVCPKCSYALVLLPKRLRYKCAKCGRLYLQRFIDNREFRRWNQKQREFEEENLKPRRSLLTEEEKKQRQRESQSKYYLKNREKINKNNGNWQRKNKERYNAYKKEHRLQNLERIRIRDMISYWRKRQRAIALQALKNKQEKAYNPHSFNQPPTYIPSELLFEKNLLWFMLVGL